MPNILKISKNCLVDLLNRKGQALLSFEGEVIYPEDLEELDFAYCKIDIHG